MAIKKITAKNWDGEEQEFCIFSGTYSDDVPKSIDEINRDIYYPMSALSMVSTMSGRIINEALRNHPNAPRYDTKGPAGQGKYYHGEKIIRFYEHINITGEGLSNSPPPWVAAADKQAEHTDMVARVMNELEPHISNAIRKVLFEEMNSNA